MSKRVLFLGESEWVVRDDVPLVTIVKAEEQIVYRRLMELLQRRLSEPSE